MEDRGKKSPVTVGFTPFWNFFRDSNFIWDIDGAIAKACVCVAGCILKHYLNDCFTLMCFLK